jgi:hypothetical protein
VNSSAIDNEDVLKIMNAVITLTEIFVIEAFISHLLLGFVTLI